MPYPPDPGGNFQSDAHRRIMAHLPNPGDKPITPDDLILERINRDPHTLAHLTTAAEVVEILWQLKEDGHAKELKAGWVNTPSGYDLLTGPPTVEATLNAPPATIGLDPTAVNGDA